MSTKTEDDLQFPAITLCSSVPFKKRGFHFTRDAFTKYAYSWQEMFDKSSKQDLKAKVTMIITAY